MKIKYLIVCIVILFLGLLCLFPFKSGLLITNDENKIFAVFPWSGDELTIGWRHSVELTLWEETYHITNDEELTFLNTMYQSYGAGTPDTDGDVTLLQNGFIKTTNIKRKMPYFSLYYVPISKYYIKNDDKTYYLADYVPDYTSIQVHPHQLSLYDLLSQNFFDRRE